MTSNCTVVVSDDPEFTEGDAHQHWAQIKQAIDEGNYTFVDVKESDSGQPVYRYRIVLEDGTTHGYGYERAAAGTERRVVGGHVSPVVDRSLSWRRFAS